MSPFTERMCRETTSAKRAGVVSVSYAPALIGAQGSADQASGIEIDVWRSSRTAMLSITAARTFASIVCEWPVAEPKRRSPLSAINARKSFDSAWLCLDQGMTIRCQTFVAGCPTRRKNGKLDIMRPHF